MLHPLPSPRIESRTRDVRDLFLESSRQQFNRVDRGRDGNPKEKPSLYRASLADSSRRLIAFPRRLMPSSVSSGGWLTKFSRRY